MNRAIVASAIHLINKNGLHSLSLEDIASSIGVSNKKIKAYFKTKSSLIEHLLEQHLEAMESHLSKNQTNTLYTILTTLTQKSLVSQEEQEYLPRLSEAFLPYVDSVELKDKYKKFYSKLHQFYMEDLERRIKNGELNEELDTYSLSTMLVSVVDSNILHNGYFKERVSKEFYIEKFLHIYFKIAQHYIDIYRTYLNKIDLTNIFQRYRYM